VQQPRRRQEGTQAVRVRDAALAANHERYVLGWILYEQDCRAAFGQAAEQITPADFGDPRRGAVFAAMQEVVAAGGEPTMQPVLDVLQQRKDAETVGPSQLLGLLRDWVPLGSTDYITAVQGVRRESHLRQLAYDARMFSDRLADADYTEDDAAQALEAMAHGQVGRRPRTMTEALPGALQQQATRPLWCGMPHAEQWLRVSPGHLITLGAETGKGKSQLAQQIAYSHAAYGLDVYVATYEMTAEELVARQLSKESGVALDVLLSGSLEDDEQALVAAAQQRIGEYGGHMEIDDTQPDIDELSLRVRLAAVRNPLLGLVVVDYLQLVPVGHHSDLRDERRQLEYITRTLQRLGQQTRVPILLVSQFTREIRQRQMRKPTLDVLRGTGRIEADSNMVLLLWHPKGYNTSWLLVAKARSGRSGRAIPLTWRPEIQTFEDGPAGERPPEKEAETEEWPT